MKPYVIQNKVLLHKSKAVKLKLCLLFFIFAIISAQGAQENDSEAIHYQKRKILIGYPPSPLPGASGTTMAPIQDVLQTMRFPSYQLSGTPLTPEQIEEDIRQFKERGFNIIKSEGNRYLFRDEGDGGSGWTYEEIIKNMKLVTTICHKHGLRFFLHLTCAHVQQPLIAKHPDWEMCEVNTSKPHINQYGGINRDVCINNEDFMAAYWQRLDRLFKETGADGLLLDEVQFFGPTTCGCRWCREKFKKETGHEMPMNMLDWSKAAHTAWLNWRCTKRIEIQQKARELIKKYNPENILVSYRGNSTTNDWGYKAAGLDIGHVGKFADSAAIECWPGGSFQYYWPFTIFELKYLRAIAENIGSAPWGLFYDHTCRTYGDVPILTWFIAMSQGVHRTYWAEYYSPAMKRRYTYCPDSRYWQPLLTWETKHEKILMNTQAAGNIAVLFSMATRDHCPKLNGKDNNWLLGFSSTCNALTDEHIPYKVIVDEDLTIDKLSRKVKTLILFNTGSLSDQASKAIRSFVKEGGILIASGSVGLFNEKGEQRKDFALADVLGCSYDQENNNGDILSITVPHDVTGDVTGEFEHRGSFILIKSLASDAKVIGTIKTHDEQEYPGILTRKYGLGKVVYFTGHPESRYFYTYGRDAIIVPGKFWKDNRDPKYGRLLAEVACYGNDELPVVAQNIPKGIVVETYLHNTQSLKGIQIHLVNFLGCQLKEGVVPLINPKGLHFPEVKSHLPDPAKPITLSVRAPDTKNVYIISPDFDAIVELPFERNGKYIKVSLPDFYRYFILYFNEGDSTEILKMNGGHLVKKLPPATKLLVEEKSPLVGAFNPRSMVVFADSTQFKGGVNRAERWQLLDEVCRFLYGLQSKVNTADINFTLKAKPLKPVLEIGGMVGNVSKISKMPLEIKLNGKIIFNGTYPAPPGWAIQEFPINANDLVIGENSLEIRNKGEGTEGNLPWFCINFIRIRVP